MGVAYKLYVSKIRANAAHKGTHKYMAPEQFSIAEITLKTDIWAFGCVILQICTGTPPFGKLRDYELMKKLDKQVSPLDYCLQMDDITKNCKLIKENPDLRQLLTDCFSFDPAKRPDATDIAASDLFKDEQKQLKNLLFIPGANL